MSSNDMELLRFSFTATPPLSEGGGEVKPFALGEVSSFSSSTVETNFSFSDLAPKASEEESTAAEVSSSRSQGGVDASGTLSHVDTNASHTNFDSEITPSQKYDHDTSTRVWTPHGFGADGGRTPPEVWRQHSAVSDNDLPSERGLASEVYRYVKGLPSEMSLPSETSKPSTSASSDKTPLQVTTCGSYASVAEGEAALPLHLRKKAAASDDKVPSEASSEKRGLSVAAAVPESERDRIIAAIKADLTRSKLSLVQEVHASLAGYVPFVDQAGSSSGPSDNCTKDVDSLDLSRAPSTVTDTEKPPPESTGDSKNDAVYDRPFDLGDLKLSTSFDIGFSPTKADRRPKAFAKRSNVRSSRDAGVATKSSSVSSSSASASSSSSSSGCAVCNCNKTVVIKSIKPVPKPLFAAKPVKKCVPFGMVDPNFYFVVEKGVAARRHALRGCKNVKIVPKGTLVRPVRVFHNTSSRWLECHDDLPCNFVNPREPANPIEGGAELRAPSESWVGCHEKCPTPTSTSTRAASRPMAKSASSSSVPNSDEADSKSSSTGESASARRGGESESQNDESDTSRGSERRKDSGLADTDWYMACPLFPESALSAPATGRDDGTQDPAPRQSSVETNPNEEEKIGAGFTRVDSSASLDWSMACPLLPRRQVHTPPSLPVEDCAADTSEEVLRTEDVSSKKPSQRVPVTSTKGEQNENVDEGGDSRPEWHKREDWCTACPLMGTFMPGDFRTSFYLTSISNLPVNVKSPTAPAHEEESKSVGAEGEVAAVPTEGLEDTATAAADGSEVDDAKVVSKCGVALAKVKTSDVGESSNRLYFDLDSEVGSMFCTHMQQAGAIAKLNLFDCISGEVLTMVLRDYLFLPEACSLMAVNREMSKTVKTALSLLTDLCFFEAHARSIVVATGISTAIRKYCRNLRRFHPQSTLPLSDRSQSDLFTIANNRCALPEFCLALGACRKIESIHTLSGFAASHSFITQMEFPNLREIALVVTRFHHVLPLLSQCPKLVKLTVGSRMQASRVENIYDIDSLRVVCPKLESLRLYADLPGEYSSDPDDHIFTSLREMRHLTELSAFTRINSSGFYLATRIESLKRLCVSGPIDDDVLDRYNMDAPPAPWIEELNIVGCRITTQLAMANDPTLLRAFPSLRRLRVCVGAFEQCEKSVREVLKSNLVVQPFEPLATDVSDLPIGVSPKVIEQFAHADRAVARLKELQQRQLQQQKAAEAADAEAAARCRRQTADGEKKKKESALDSPTMALWPGGCRSANAGAEETKGAESSGGATVVAGESDKTGSSSSKIYGIPSFSSLTSSTAEEKSDVLDDSSAGPSFTPKSGSRSVVVAGGCRGLCASPSTCQARCRTLASASSSGSATYWSTANSSSSAASSRSATSSNSTTSSSNATKSTYVVSDHEQQQRRCVCKCAACDQAEEKLDILAHEWCMRHRAVLLRVAKRFFHIGRCVPLRASAFGGGAHHRKFYTGVRRGSVVALTLTPTVFEFVVRDKQLRRVDTRFLMSVCSQPVPATQLGIVSGGGGQRRRASPGICMELVRRVQTATAKTRRRASA